MSLPDDEEEVTGTYLTKTDKAILLDLDGAKEWFPLSQIGFGDLDPDELEPDTEITILVPAWLLRKRGL